MEAETLRKELQTVKKIERVKAMLEQSKKIDETQQQYMENLKKIVAAGRATLSMYAEISETNIIFEERILNCVNSALKYSVNPEKVFKWCDNFETHLSIAGRYLVNFLLSLIISAGSPSRFVANVV